MDSHEETGLPLTVLLEQEAARVFDNIRGKGTQYDPTAPETFDQWYGFHANLTSQTPSLENPPYAPEVVPECKNVHGATTRPMENEHAYGFEYAEYDALPPDSFVRQIWAGIDYSVIDRFMLDAVERELAIQNENRENARYKLDHLDESIEALLQDGIFAVFDDDVLPRPPAVTENELSVAALFTQLSTPRGFRGEMVTRSKLAVLTPAAREKMTENIANVTERIASLEALRDSINAGTFRRVFCIKTCGMQYEVPRVPDPATAGMTPEAIRATSCLRDWLRRFRLGVGAKQE